MAVGVGTNGSGESWSSGGSWLGLWVSRARFTVSVLKAYGRKDKSLLLGTYPCRFSRAHDLGERT